MEAVAFFDFGVYGGIYLCVCGGVKSWWELVGMKNAVALMRAWEIERHFDLS